MDFGGSSDSYLPIAKFSYYNIYHSSISGPLYELLYRRKWRTLVCQGEVDHWFGGELRQSSRRQSSSSKSGCSCGQLREDRRVMLKNRDLSWSYRLGIWYYGRYHPGRLLYASGRGASWGPNFWTILNNSMGRKGVLSFGFSSRASPDSQHLSCFLAPKVCSR